MNLSVFRNPRLRLTWVLMCVAVLSSVAAVVVVSNGSLVAVQDCDMTVSHDGRMIIKGTLTNRTADTFSEVSVIAETTGPGYVGSPKVIVGPLKPHQEVRLKAIEESTLNVLPGYIPGQHERVNRCYVQAVKYADGRLKILYMPV